MNSPTHGMVLSMDEKPTIQTIEWPTSIIRGKKAQTKKREEFQKFMAEIVRDHPAKQDIHVTLDNLSTHKRNKEWLSRHPNVTFHFMRT